MLGLAGDFQRTLAGTYTVYYKVDGTADYTGVAANTTPISVTIAPKSVTPTRDGLPRTNAGGIKGGGDAGRVDGHRVTGQQVSINISGPVAAMWSGA